MENYTFTIIEKLSKYQFTLNYEQFINWLSNNWRPCDITKNYEIYGE